MRFQKLVPLLALFAFLACNAPQKAASSTPGKTDVASSSVQTSAALSTPPASVVSKVQAIPSAFVTWDKKMVELGKVKKGEKRTLFFEFTNTSGQEVQIDIVDACECTRVDFPRGAIPAGGKGKLDVTFDSTEKDADETIGINVVFKQTDAAGNPRIETVEYKFELVK